MTRKTKESVKPKPAEKPVSLHPLKFEEAVEGLLRVKSGKNTRESGKGSDKD